MMIASEALCAISLAILVGLKHVAGDHLNIIEASTQFEIISGEKKKFRLRNEHLSVVRRELSEEDIAHLLLDGLLLKKRIHEEMSIYMTMNAILKYLTQDIVSRILASRVLLAGVKLFDDEDVQGEQAKATAATIFGLRELEKRQRHQA